MLGAIVHGASLPTITPAPKNGAAPMLRRQIIDVKLYPSSFTTDTFAWFVEFDELGQSTSQSPLEYVVDLQWWTSSSSYLAFCASGTSMSLGTTMLYSYDCPPAFACANGWMTNSWTTRNCAAEGMQCKTDIYYFSKGGTDALLDIGCEADPPLGPLVVPPSATSNIPITERLSASPSSTPTGHAAPTDTASLDEDQGQHQGSNGSRSNTPAIVGGCVGGGLALIAALVTLYICRRKRLKAGETYEPGGIGCGNAKELDGGTKKEQVAEEKMPVVDATVQQNDFFGGGNRMESAPQELYGIYSPPADTHELYVEPAIAREKGPEELEGSRGLNETAGRQRQAHEMPGQ